MTGTTRPDIEYLLLQGNFQPHMIRVFVSACLQN